MDIIISLLGLGIASLLLGIFFLIRFAKTKKRLFLILGIIFALIIPGIIVYTIFRYRPGMTMVYGPPPGVMYGPLFPHK